MAAARWSEALHCKWLRDRHTAALAAVECHAETGQRAPPSMSPSWLQDTGLSLQGTLSSKKKKQAKLKRVMGALRKNARKERGTGAESFAAVQLLNDPQVRCLLSCAGTTGFAAVQTRGALSTEQILAGQL